MVGIEVGAGERILWKLASQCKYSLSKFDLLFEGKMHSDAFALLWKRVRY